MKVGVVILCRYSSARLPGKVLRPLRGFPALKYIVDRVSAVTSSWIVATSENSSDDPIEALCALHGWPCFRGPLNNVADRFLSAAKSLGLDYVTRINGDNILADTTTLKQMLDIAETGLYDFISNVPGRTFPYGMSVEILRVPFYEKLIARFTADEREHVTAFLYNNPSIGSRFIYRNLGCPSAAGLHLALDTVEDMAFLENILDHLPKPPVLCSLAEITDIARRLQHSNPWEGKHGPLLIAEIGGNHEGNYEAAIRLTELAIAIGVDYIKFQLYCGDSLVNPLEDSARNAHFKRFELTREQHEHLAELCRAAGIGYMASVWDVEMLAWIDPWLSIYKVGSGDFTARPIVRELAKRGKPMIMATGLCTLAEIVSEVAFVQSINPAYLDPRHLALLQCTAMYPIPSEDANLAVLNTLRDATGLTVGYSDHTRGVGALRMAAAMGAQILEFHFTDKREGQSFRDHQVSLLPEEVRRLQEDLDEMGALRGDGIKAPEKSEMEAGHITSFRRALYPRHSLPRGSVLTTSSLACLRPNYGIDARDIDNLLGAKLNSDIQKDQRLDRSMFDYETQEQGDPGFCCRLCGGTRGIIEKVIRQRPDRETDYLVPPDSYKRSIVRCLRCGVFNNVHQYVNDSFYTGFYNSASYGDRMQKRYEQIRALPPDKSDNKGRAARLNDYLKSRGRGASETNILDVGMGLCVFLAEMKDYGYDCYGIDPDPLSVDRAQRIVGITGATIGNAETFYMENRFHLITYNKVLEHLSDPLAALRHAKFFLKEGGTIYVELPDGQSASAHSGFIDRQEFFIEHLTIWGHASLRWLANASDLKVVDINAIHEPSDKFSVYAMLQKM